MKSDSVILFSIIIPVYNASSTINKCVDSILEQRITSIEIILVDDGSTDASLDVIKSYEDISFVNILSQPNSGVSAARNKGLDNASGTYVCFVDADDFLENNYLEELLTEIHREKVDIIDQSFFRVDSQNVKIFEGYTEGKKICHEDKSTWLNAIFNGHTGVFPKLFKANIIREHSIRFNEELTLFEDIVFILEYMEHSVNGIYFSSRSNYNYCFVSTSLSNSFYSKHLSITLKPLLNIFKLLNSDFYGSVVMDLDSVPNLKTKLVKLSMFFLETFSNGSIREKIDALQSLRDYNLHLIWKAISTKNPFRKLFHYLYRNNFVMAAVLIDTIRVGIDRKR